MGKHKLILQKGDQLITFKKDGCYKNNNVKKNIEDINYFIKSLGESLNGEKYNLPGYKNIDFYVKYLEIIC